MLRLPFLALSLLILGASAGRAQLPFYTDDPAVTSRGTLHFEFFNEYDSLHASEFPDLRQNTANFKVNFGLPHRLESDFDAPHLSIYRAPFVPSASGMGDADLGIKWNLLASNPGSHGPSVGASLYIEFPTGDAKQQLSSALTDYWLNFMIQGQQTCATSNPSPCDGRGRKLVLARRNSIGLGKISTESGYRNRFGNPYIFDCSRV